MFVILGKNKYFTHKSNQLNETKVGEIVKVSGWVANKRDHGSLLFIDLRDHTGIVQCLIENGTPAFEKCDDLSLESVVSFVGKVQMRPEGTINREIASGEIDIRISYVEIISEAQPLPFAIHQQDVAEDLRLKYRFLDLRRDEMQERLKLRFNIIKKLRSEIEQHGFIEVQTPLLTSSSPEGARDYVVPSRIHPGKFYALPQAPQQFKQLLMVAGLHRYYQVAPCFRDEDTRSDRAPGAFYQLDLEMSFATQDDVFEVVESVIYNTFKEFSVFSISKPPFVRIRYADAMAKYASDKPDLRNPLSFIDIISFIQDNPPKIFDSIIKNKGKIFLLPVTGLKYQTRSFFDEMNEFALSIGAKGLGYLVREDEYRWKGSLANIMPESVKHMIDKSFDGAFVIAHENINEFYRIASSIRDKLGRDLDLINKNSYEFCWIVDFPMYEADDHGKFDFCHNPFSMPQGGMDDLRNKNPADIVAWQYDLVCNGCELSSGAVRNHSPEIMYEAFKIAGYTEEDVNKRFGAMINAFKYGAPPHAGIAPGIDRIVMILAGVKNLREIIPFPLNQNAVDLMMDAPSELTAVQLRDLRLKVVI